MYTTIPRTRARHSSERGWLEIRHLVIAPLAVLVVAILAFAAAPGGASSAQAEPIQLEWKSLVYRIGGPMPLRIVTRDEKYSKQMKASALVFKCADGKERRVASSVRETKVVIDQGNYITEVDAGQLATTPVPGKFELFFELSDGHRMKPLRGVFVKTIDRPLDALEKAPKPEEMSRVAVIFETDAGNIMIGLRPDKAPNTVRNFVKLTSENFYEGKVFHRIRRGFVIQTGGVRADGTAVGSEKIKGEFSNLAHERGVVSMARPGDDNDGATCQFFFCLVNISSLDGKYASFGKVLHGLEVMDRIAMTPVDFNPELKEMSKPNKAPLILKAYCVEKVD